MYKRKDFNILHGDGEESSESDASESDRDEAASDESGGALGMPHDVCCRSARELLSSR